jgi:uncharacterized protein (TIGR02466 family)
MTYLWADSEDLNKELTRLILSKEQEDAGVSTTNVGGWHSKKDLQDWEGRCVRTLISRILTLGQEMLKSFTNCTDPKLLADWTVQAWANINRYGHYNKYHTHIRNLNLWSGVYYIDTGTGRDNNATNARIAFADQHQVKPRGRDEYVERYFVQPEPGLMLLFPSSLGHRVEPYNGSGNRITVAFNLRNSGFTTTNYEIEANKLSKIQSKDITRDCRGKDSGGSPAQANNQPVSGSYSPMAERQLKERGICKDQSDEF